MYKPGKTQDDEDMEDTSTQNRLGRYEFFIGINDSKSIFYRLSIKH